MVGCGATALQIAKRQGSDKHILDAWAFMFGDQEDSFTEAKCV